MSPHHLLTGLPEATPAAIRGARETAGLSMEAAAALVGMAGRQSWYKIEAQGWANSAAWALFLLSVGQHPAFTVAAPPAAQS